MSSKPKTTSLEKLYEVLSARHNPHSSIEAVWKESLDINGSNHLSVAQVHAQMIVVLQDAIAQVNALPHYDEKDKEALTLPLQVATLALLETPLNSSWDEFSRSFGRAEVNSLRQVAAVLKRELPDYSLTADEKTEFLTHLRELRDLVDASELPDELKMLISKHIYEIEESIRFYNVYGISKIRERLNSIVGVVAVENYKNPEHKGRWESIIEKVKWLVNLTSVVNSGYELAENINDFPSLPPFSG